MQLYITYINVKKKNKVIKSYKNLVLFFYLNLEKKFSYFSIPRITLHINQKNTLSNYGILNKSRVKF